MLSIAASSTAAILHNHTSWLFPAAPTIDTACLVRKSRRNEHYDYDHVVFPNFDSIQLHYDMRHGYSIPLDSAPKVWTQGLTYHVCDSSIWCTEASEGTVVRVDWSCGEKPARLDHTTAWEREKLVLFSRGCATALVSLLLLLSEFWRLSLLNTDSSQPGDRYRELVMLRSIFSVCLPATRSIILALPLFHEPFGKAFEAWMKPYGADGYSILTQLSELAVLADFDAASLSKFWRLGYVFNNIPSGLVVSCVWFELYFMATLLLVFSPLIRENYDPATAHSIELTSHMLLMVCPFPAMWRFMKNALRTSRAPRPIFIERRHRLEKLMKRCIAAYIILAVTLRLISVYGQRMVLDPQFCIHTDTWLEELYFDLSGKRACIYDSGDNYEWLAFRILPMLTYPITRAIMSYAWLGVAMEAAEIGDFNEDEDWRWGLPRDPTPGDRMAALRHWMDDF